MLLLLYFVAGVLFSLVGLDVWVFGEGESVLSGLDNLALPLSQSLSLPLPRPHRAALGGMQFIDLAFGTHFLSSPLDVFCPDHIVLQNVLLLEPLDLSPLPLVLFDLLVQIGLYWSKRLLSPVTLDLWEKLFALLN